MTGEGRRYTGAACTQAPLGLASTKGRASWPRHLGRAIGHVPGHRHAHVPNRGLERGGRNPVPRNPRNTRPLVRSWGPDRAVLSYLHLARFFLPLVMDETSLNGVAAKRLATMPVARLPWTTSSRAQRVPELNESGGMLPSHYLKEDYGGRVPTGAHRRLSTPRGPWRGTRAICPTTQPCRGRDLARARRARLRPIIPSIRQSRSTVIPLR